MQVRYNAKRFVPGSRTPNGPQNIMLCLVQIELPDGGITSLVIPEGLLTETCGQDRAKQELEIQRQVAGVVTSMMAGAVGDLQVNNKIN